MNNKRYKDIKATLIVLLMIGGVFLPVFLNEIMSKEAKEIAGITIIVLIIAIFIFAIWKFIRMTLD